MLTSSSRHSPLSLNTWSTKFTVSCCPQKASTLLFEHLVGGGADISVWLLETCTSSEPQVALWDRNEGLVPAALDLEGALGLVILPPSSAGIPSTSEWPPSTLWQCLCRGNSRWSPEYKTTSYIPTGRNQSRRRGNERAVPKTCQDLTSCLCVLILKTYLSLLPMRFFENLKFRRKSTVFNGSGGRKTDE